MTPFSPSDPPSEGGDCFTVSKNQVLPHHPITPRVVLGFEGMIEISNNKTCQEKSNPGLPGPHVGKVATSPLTSWGSPMLSAQIKIINGYLAHTWPRWLHYRCRLGGPQGGIFALRAHCALLLDYVPPEEPPSTPLGNALRIR